MLHILVSWKACAEWEHGIESRVTWGPATSLHAMVAWSLFKNLFLRWRWAVWRRCRISSPGFRWEVIDQARFDRYLSTTYMLPSFPLQVPSISLHTRNHNKSQYINHIYSRHCILSLSNTQITHLRPTSRNSHNFKMGAVVSCVRPTCASAPNLSLRRSTWTWTQLTQTPDRRYLPDHWSLPYGHCQRHCCCPWR